MSTLVVDAYEGRYVRIFDVPGAYLNADIPDEKDVRLKFEGEFVHIMCYVNLDNIPNYCSENVNKVLYLNMMKYIHGYIELALLWYDFYVNILK